MIPSNPGGKRGNYYQLLDNDPPPKKKYNLNNKYDFPLMQNKTSNQKTITQSKFLTIKSIDENKPINSFNVFLVHKALESITLEKPEKITFTRDGNLLILTKSDSQTNKFLKASSLSNLCKIKAELHPTLNISKGVIFCPSLTNLTEKEIVEGLTSQHITECKKITKFKDGTATNTPLHILSFNLFEVPKEIDIAWEKCKVDPYIPSPMLCNNCFRIGHTKKHCQSETKCLVCSASEHSEPCTKVKCINCNEEHRSNNKKCPVYIKRQQIIKHKTIFKSTYREAVNAVNQADNGLSAPIPTDSLEESLSLKTKFQNKKNELQNKTTTQVTTQNKQDSSQNNKPLNSLNNTSSLSNNSSIENSTSQPISSTINITETPNFSSSSSSSSSYLKTTNNQKLHYNTDFETNLQQPKKSKINKNRLNSSSSSSSDKME